MLMQIANIRRSSVTCIPEFIHFCLFCEPRITERGSEKEKGREKGARGRERERERDTDGDRDT